MLSFYTSRSPPLFFPVHLLLLFALLLLPFFLLFLLFLFPLPLPEAFCAPMDSEVELSAVGGAGPEGALCCLTKQEPARLLTGDAMIWLREDSWEERKERKEEGQEGATNKEGGRGANWQREKKVVTNMYLSTKSQ